MTMDEFFDVAFEGYRSMLSVARMRAANAVPVDGSHLNEREYAESAYELYIRAKANAQTEWFDPQLRAIYEQQHAIAPRVNRPEVVTPR